MSLCRQCLSIDDYCVGPWVVDKDDMIGFHKPPRSYCQFLALSIWDQPPRVTFGKVYSHPTGVWGLHQGDVLNIDGLVNFLLTDDYCEAVAFAAVLAVSRS